MSTSVPHVGERFAREYGRSVVPNFGANRAPSVSLTPSDAVYFGGAKTEKLTYEHVNTYDIDYLGRVHQYQFSNGLEAYIIQDPDAEDLVSYGVAVKVGNVNETEATNGGAHFFEHEIFKGTHKIPTMQAPKILQALGSGVNAYTSNDVTFFYGYEFEKPALPDVIELWTEMLMNHAFPEKELNRERGVVIEEIKRSLNNAMVGLYQALIRNVWADHRYRRTVLGPIKNIERMPIDGFKDYYAKHYVPSNQAAVAIGDFDDGDIGDILQKLSDEYAQTFDSKPVRKLPALPAQTGNKNVLIRKNVNVAVTRQGFDGPRPNEPDTAKEIVALDMLTNVMGGGKSGRLHQRLVEQDRLANDVGIYLMVNGQRSLVGLSAQSSPDNVEQVKAVIREEIDRLIADGVSDEELDRARIVTEDEAATFNENQRTKLNMVGKLVAQGRLDKYFGNQVNMANEITSADIQAAARKYMGADQAYTASLVPKDYPVQAFEKSGKTARVQFAGSLGPQDKSEVLPGGTELVVREKPGSNKKTAVSIVLQGGNRIDEIPGTTDVLAMMLQRGTRKWSATELQQRLGAKKLALSFSSYTDQVVLGINGLKRFTPDMMDILTEVVQNPTFREEDLAFVKKQLASRIGAKLQTQSQERLKDLMLTSVYAENHPYGHQGSRILDNLERITLDDVRKAYDALFTQGNMTVSVVGDTTLEAVREPIQTMVSAFPEGQSSIPDAPAVRFATDGVVTQIDDSLKQAEINRVWAMPDVHDEDRSALLMLDYILSGGFARFFMRFREGEEGLCYTASTAYTPRQQAGDLKFYIGTDPKNITKVLGMFQHEVDLLVNERVPQEEFENQRRFLKARLKAGEQSTATVSKNLAKHRAFDHPSTVDLLVQLEALTPADIQRVAKKYLTRPSKTIVIAPEAALKKHGLM